MNLKISLVQIGIPSICCLALLCAPACAPDQLVVVVDTDAVAFDMLDDASPGPLTEGTKRFSAAAVIDAVRVDVLDEMGQSIDACEFGSVAMAQWPLSFGIARNEHARYLRVRGFRKSFAQPAGASGLTTLCGKGLSPGAAAVLSEPPPAVTIERFVSLPQIDSVRKTGLILSLSCIGAAASLIERTSCVGGAVLPPAQAQFEDPAQWSDAYETESSPSQVGQSPFAVLTPCKHAAPSGPLIEKALCIPGGLTIQGDLTAKDADPGLESSPLRAVMLSPFFLDRDEVAVRRYKLFLNAAAENKYPLGKPHTGSDYDPTKDYFELGNCTWGLPFSYKDALPVNCVDIKDARAACKLTGGDLPSEAQWEHAARGLGAELRFPWGDLRPEQSEGCCISALARLPLMMGDPENPPTANMYRCSEQGPAPVGSYSRDSCPEGGDETVEGIRDLGGNVSELVADDFRPYAKRCGLQYGLSQDPICKNPFISQSILRGGHFYDFATDYARPSRRRLLTNHVGFVLPNFYPGADAGFRCAYKDL